MGYSTYMKENQINKKKNRKKCGRPIGVTSECDNCESLDFQMKRAVGHVSFFAKCCCMCHYGNVNIIIFSKGDALDTTNKEQCHLNMLQPAYIGSSCTTSPAQV